MVQAIQEITINEGIDPRELLSRGRAEVEHYGGTIVDAWSRKFPALDHRSAGSFRVAPSMR